MTVHRKWPFGGETLSLSRQISRTASRLDARKKTATALGFSLGSRIRSGCASPGGLWLAGCAGFLAAEWVHRPVHEPRPTREQAPSSHRHSQAATMSKALFLLKFALDLRMLWGKADPANSCPREDG